MYVCLPYLKFSDLFNTRNAHIFLFGLILLFCTYKSELVPGGQWLHVTYAGPKVLWEGPTLTIFFFPFFLVEEGREKDLNTAKCGPSSACQQNLI